MNIAIDIDDTLTDSFDYFLPFVAEYFGAEISELKARNISYSNLPPAWKAHELDFCRAVYDRAVPDTTFKSDAAWGVQQLRAQGHRIIIITARTHEFYTDPYKTTVEELTKGGIVYDKLICTADKATACIEEQISVLIDDMPGNCAAATAVGIPAVLFTSKANRNMQTDFPRVSNWKEAVKLILTLKSK